MNNEATHKKHKKENILRILVCLLAIMSLITAFTYTVFAIIKDQNATKRLLLEAFMEIDRAPVDSTVTVQTSEIIAVTDAPEKREIVSADLSQNKVTIMNQTANVIDDSVLASYLFDKHLFDTRPMILIYHSDPEAAYLPEGMTSVSSSYTFQNQSENVKTLGNTITDVLASAGIASIHLTEPINDIEETLKAYREAYPGIRYCLDVRRDGIYATDGRIVKTAGKIDNTTSAQLMLAVGTGIGSEALNFQKNLAAAYQLSDMLTKASPTVTREIFLCADSLGQQDETLHFTLFVGSCGNTLQEAATAARFFARYLALFILSNCGVGG